MPLSQGFALFAPATLLLIFLEVEAVLQDFKEVPQAELFSERLLRGYPLNIKTSLRCKIDDELLSELVK